MSVEIVATELLGCSYREGRVLEDISFTVNAGDYVGIVGPNGSGKSTLIQALLGVVPICSGSARLFGSGCGGFNQWGRVGYLPQSLQLLNPIFPATVAETVGLGLLSLKKFPRRFTRHDRETVDELLENLDIYDIRSKLIGELSGGQQQRVLLARALVKINPDWRTIMRKGGFLTRDARVKERKKPGLKKARKAPTYTKR